ncbi:response regulator [Pseudodesulfovibrio sediminis]|uniref:Anti-anti-sigma factor n=1 Tax=Pseudodesulfovibrio sediminis TaxID=2810563 RepID=A0ABN6EWW1_9BACT|nr:response regulator [Pseudodesulfovibrio sediminis]BCS89735.1 hypothetical protein PSDVSF_29770 [Pseudodesulfovibrio sediminis]
MIQKVLIIDDEQPTLRMFTLLLQAYGYEVLTAENGQEGVNLYDAERPDLVLTDIKMPVMDGIEALKEIKKISPHAEVIVITGHGDMDLALQALNLDATDFINKPLQREALELALKRTDERLAIARSEEEQIEFEEQDNTAIIGVRGNVTATTIPHLSETFEKAKALGKDVILIDFEKNASLNGAGITGLTDLLQQDQNQNVRVILSGLSSNFKAVLASVGITKLAELFDTVEEALAAQ